MFGNFESYTFILHTNKTLFYVTGKFVNFPKVFHTLKTSCNATRSEIKKFTLNKRIY